MKKLSLIVLVLLLLLTYGCKKEQKCPDDFNLNGGICEREVDHNDAEEVLVCDEGFELKEKSCYKVEEAVVKEKYGCDKGLTLTDGKCVGTLKKSQIAAYRCAKGDVNGTKCIILTEKPSALTKTAKCPDGYSLKEGSCWKGERPPISNNCDVYAHIYDGCSCDAPDVLGPDYFCYSSHKSASYDYKCESGTVLKNNKCYVESTTDAESYKTCDSGYKLSGSECIKEVNTKATTTKYCDEEYVLKDNKCIKETIKDAKKEYQCSNDFEYRDGLCRKFEKVEAK